MAQLRDVAILVFAIFAAVLPQSIEADDYVVGGDIGWTSFPPGGASFYSKWAANFTFKVNDNLVFNFEPGSHSVAIVTKDNYDKCQVNDNIQSFNRGPATITLNRTGKFYFTCSLSGHCTSGQKLSVKVTASSSSAEGPFPSVSGSVPTSSPSNEGAPSSSTEQGATTDPPSQGSATPLAATFSLLLIASVFNFLF